MNYLTYKEEGTPVAKLILDDNEKIISIACKDTETEKCCKKCKPNCKGGCCKAGCCKKDSDSDIEIDNEDLDFLDNDYFRKMKLPYRINGEKLKKDILEGAANKKIMKATKEYLKEKTGKEIIVHNGEIRPIPKTDGRECIYVAGPSGSGKSTYIANYAKEYKKMYPKNKIYVFSRVLEDKCIDKLNPIRILINEELIEDPIDPNELSNSLVIFDDTDTIPIKNLKDAITRLKNDLLETGRHENIYAAITSHLISNYRETRTVLNEAHSITVFPQGGSTYSIKYVLQNYGGMDKKSIAKAIALPSRWITLKKTYPQAIIYSKGIYLLSN